MDIAEERKQQPDEHPNQVRDHSSPSAPHGDGVLCTSRIFFRLQRNMWESLDTRLFSITTSLNIYPATNSCEIVLWG